jgi:ATP-dependent Clp protease ATP-binding subunit ClpX
MVRKNKKPYTFSNSSSRGSDANKKHNFSNSGNKRDNTPDGKKKTYNFSSSEEVPKEKERDYSFAQETVEDKIDSPHIIKEEDLKITREDVSNQRKIFDILKDESKIDDFLDFLEYELNTKIVGQKNASGYLSMAITEHLQNIIQNEKSHKPGLLLIGPTGSGKTYVVETILKYFHVPFVSADLTKITVEGYQGDNITVPLSELVDKSREMFTAEQLKNNPDIDIKYAEKYGVILFDELDKIAKNKEMKQKDVSGEEVQKRMLKLLYGSEETIKGDRKIRTDNILFFCAGAFADLESRVDLEKTCVSLDDDFDDFDDSVEEITETSFYSKLKGNVVETLVEYGIIKEFFGRIGNWVVLNEHSKENIKEMLLEKKNHVLGEIPFNLLLNNLQRKYKNLSFTDDAVDLMVDRAYEENKNIGGRAVNSLCNFTKMQMKIYLRHHRTQYPFDSEIKVDAEMLEEVLDYVPSK